MSAAWEQLNRLRSIKLLNFSKICRAQRLLLREGSDCRRTGKAQRGAKDANNED
jgi:hypothetical protein